MTRFPVHGAGLGLRRGLFPALKGIETGAIDFLEVAPENWIGVGGRFGRQFAAFAEQYPLVCHGLSLSIGSPHPLDIELLAKIREFMDRFNVRAYTEHLSYCSDHGHLYDLMPIPFTLEAVDYVVKRVRQVQEVLDRRIGLEHVSYYAAPGQEMREIDFLKAVVEGADCDLLLDVNNIFVNSVNHGYDADEFLEALPLDRVTYIHVAGHYDEAPGLKIDTHGTAVIAPVWRLLQKAYDRLGNVPTLLERDFNFPPIAELLAELNQVRRFQAEAGHARADELPTHGSSLVDGAMRS